MWQFAKDILGGLLRFLRLRRQWETQDLAEIEQMYAREIQQCQELLKDAEADEERGHIKGEIRRLRQELRAFYQGKRELLLSRTVMQRMTPKGAISPSLPELPAADRQTLELATAVRGALEAPKSFDDHFERGNAFYAAERFHEALQEYSAALALRPDDPDDLDALDALANRSAALHGLGRLEDALADLDSALQLRPDQFVTLAIRGNALVRLQRCGPALADLNSALQLRPGHPWVLYDRACLFSLTKRWEDSLRDLQQAISSRDTYRAMAREDNDLEPLRNDPQWGPKFRELVETEE